VHEWEAHTDYIRFIEIHPTRPYILSASDDMSIKLWDWDKNFECVQVSTSYYVYIILYVHHIMCTSYYVYIILCVFVY
jgi:coatomer subunit beta'